MSVGGSSAMGDPHHNSEGQIDFKMDPKNARQDVPSQNIQNKGAQFGAQYPIDSLRADTSPIFDGRHDDSRQDVPGENLPGGLDAEGCGVDVDWSAVGPIKYPYPKDSIKVNPPPHPLA